ncbi:hypothetical protein [Streptomyces bathyalis]|uniref:phosphotriesterase family protein n=1 Tax=Streptomyces bathyalis TaxID=2710756 RepID=UPI0018D1B503
MGPCATRKGASRRNRRRVHGGFPRRTSGQWQTGPWRGWGARDVLPALRERGVTEEQIATMMTGNPRRILQRGAPY